MLQRQIPIARQLWCTYNHAVYVVMRIGHCGSLQALGPPCPSVTPSPSLWVYSENVHALDGS